jgi:Xaa-Pro dipeptidase
VPDRLERVRAWMESEDATAAYVSDPVSIGYLSGFSSEPHERLLALVVREGAAVLIVPGLEQESAAGAARGVEVRAWQDGSDPWREVSAALDGTVKAAGRLAVEKSHLPLAAWERLQAIAGADATPLDVAPTIRAMRARKTPEELALLERAAGITDQVTLHALAMAEPGRSELEISAEIGLLVAQAGARLSFETIVGSGPNTALPHLRPSARQLRAGDLVMIDCGAALEGYKADITRTVVLGEPDQRQQEVFDAVLEAHDAAASTVRAGVTAGEVDEAARGVIRAAGLGDFFIHRTGHGLGLEAHEDPSLDPGSATVLEAGMVVTVEPGVYIAGWGGVRIEDDLVVEERGSRSLTRAERRLKPLPAG